MEEYLKWLLNRVGRDAEEAERQEAAMQRLSEPLPPPEWKVELSRIGSGPYRVISRTDARRLLAADVEGCPFCEPHIELRMEVGYW